MNKFFAAFLFVVATFSSQTAFAGDWRVGGHDREWNRPIYGHHSYGGGHDYYRSRHHGGERHNNNQDLWLGLAIGTGIGIIAAQPPAYYVPPVYYPRRCWTEWYPVNLYDHFDRQLGQNVTICE